MRILIAGGSGFIGSHLSSYLSKKGHQVLIVSRDPSKGIAYDEVHRHVDANTVIVNLAGENIASGRWTTEKKRRIRESRIRSGRKLVEEIRKSGKRPGVFVQASAIGYYGRSLDEEFDELSPPGDDFLARVVVDWENSTREIEEMGIRRVIIRIGLVLSKNGGAYPRMSFPFRLGLGGRIGSGKQWMSWIHIDDVVRAVEFLMEGDFSGPFNLTAPYPVRNGEFTRTLCEVLRRPCFFHVPSFLLRLLFGEMADYLLLDGQKVIPRRLMESGFQFLYPDLRKALMSLEDVD